jgi:arsenate reductase-like glutaredoxin family protein
MTKYLNTKSGSIEDVVKQMQNKVLESDYQDKFKKELDKAGKPLGQMTGAEKKAFFNKVDKMHSAKNEKVDNPYAVGMAAAMKAKNDQPPLKKSTITKAHDIAKSIEKDQKEEVKEARWEIEGRVSYKGISSEDSFHMVIDAPSKDAAERKAYNELDKARQRKKIGPGGGGSIDDADIESIEKTNDKLSSPESGPMMNSYDPKLKEDFFVNDKNDTLKKFSGRIGYNKSTLTDYLAKKTGKNKDDVYFDDTELVYKDKTVLRNAETKTVDQMLKALKKEEVHPHVKQMVKKGDSDEKIKKMHPELKDDELEKLKETHMSTAKSQNQKQKEVGGEKEPIKTPKNEWKTFAMMAAELREKKEEKEDKKEMQAGDDTRDKSKKTMTGQIATSPEMNPKVDYKY